MRLNRREFGRSVGLTCGAILANSALGRILVGKSKVKVGICDWTLGRACDPAMLVKAKNFDLDGVQVSVGEVPQSIPLRDPGIRRKYIELSKKHGVMVCSVAAGPILNSIPLKSEPQSAVYVIDALEAAAALGAKNIMMAFFRNGELRARDREGRLKNLSKGQYASYALDGKGVDRVVAALRQIAPRAEDLGVAMGFENTLTAEQNIEIIERVGSSAFQVYYDVGNSWDNGYDVPTEIRLLGKDRICEIHLKDRKSAILGGPEGEVDFETVAEACSDIGYDKWFVLETLGREGSEEADTRAHAAFARKTFG